MNGAEIIILGVYYRPPKDPWKLTEQICRDITGSCKAYGVVIVGILTCLVQTGTAIRPRA